MKLLISLLLLSSQVFAARQTWIGRISDSMCGADHSGMANGGKKVDPRDCSLLCVKEGAKFIFVNKGKVYGIGNQGLDDLAKHAGHNVTLTGDLAADGKTITVSTIDPISRP